MGIWKVKTSFWSQSITLRLSVVRDKTEVAEHQGELTVQSGCDNEIHSSDTALTGRSFCYKMDVFVHASIMLSV